MGWYTLEKNLPSNAFNHQIGYKIEHSAGEAMHEQTYEPTLKGIIYTCFILTIWWVTMTHSEKRVFLNSQWDIIWAVIAETLS